MNHVKQVERKVCILNQPFKMDRRGTRLEKTLVFIFGVKKGLFQSLSL